MNIRNLILITATISLTGCAGLGTAIMCSGTGTCHTDANGRYITTSTQSYYSGAAAPSGFKGAVIVTNSGNYVLTPNATGSLPSAVIRSGR
jgi:hypothetical protein